MTAKDEKEVIEFTKRCLQEEVRCLENSRKKMTEFTQDFTKRQEQLISDMESRFTKAIEKQTEDLKSFLSAEVSRQLKESRKEEAASVCACRSSTTAPDLKGLSNLSISSDSGQETPQSSRAQTPRLSTPLSEMTQNQIEAERMAKISNDALIAGNLHVKFDPTGLTPPEVLLSAISFLHIVNYILKKLLPNAEDNLQRLAIIQCLGGSARDKAICICAPSAPALLSWFDNKYGEGAGRLFLVYDHMPRLSQIKSLVEYVTEFESLLLVNQMAKKKEPEGSIMSLFMSGIGDFYLHTALQQLQCSHKDRGTLLKMMLMQTRQWALNGAVQNPKLGYWRAKRDYGNTRGW